MGSRRRAGRKYDHRYTQLLRLSYFLLLGVCLDGSLAQAQHATILPAPQQIAYGAGTLPLAGLPVRLPSGAAEEDRLAAQTLADCVTYTTGAQTAILASAGDSGLTLHRTVSIGWAAFPWNIASPVDLSYEEVLALADRALYRAKNSGRNQAIGALPPESAAEPHTSVPHGDSEARVSEIAATASYITTHGLETTSIT